MRRQLFTIASALSLVICLATVVLWGRSYWVGEQVRWRTRDHSWFVTSNHGAILVLWADGDAMPVRGERLAHAAWPAFPTVPTGGFNMRPLALGFEFGAGTLSPPMPYRAVLVPWWALTAICGVSALFTGRLYLRRRRRDRRRRLNLCPSCGYDLRATPDHCPECGTAPSLEEKEGM